MKQKDHRIMEHTESEGTLKDHEVQSLLLSSGKEHEFRIMCSKVAEAEEHKAAEGRCYLGVV